MTTQEFRVALAKLRLTRVEAAEALGVGKRTIYRYCSGKTEIPRVVELAMETLMRSGPAPCNAPPMSQSTRTEPS